MSVAASRWAINYLLEHPTPDMGGMSHNARTVLLVLGIHAGYPPQGVGAHVADCSAVTVGKVLGRSEKSVRRWFAELEARAVIPVIRRRGKAARWHFLIPPMSTPRTPGVRGRLVHTPDIRDRDPGHLDVRRRDEGDVLTDIYAISRGAER